jgi:Domain of unknown function (DUF3846)
MYMSEKYKVVAVEKGKAPYEADMTFEDMQKFIGGYIQTLPVYDDKIILVDEEGMMKELPPNRHLILQDFGMEHHVILGNFVVISAEPPEFRGLTDIEVKEALHVFRSTSPDATIII